MQLSKLRDQELISGIKALVQHERDCVTKILHHLKEIERRKLFCDFGCKSLFEYAVKELKYSDGQAGRRIQAMRLLKEIPEIESKLASGNLNLSNVAKAQGFFREVEKSDGPGCLTKGDKLEVLKQLENKTAREGDVELANLRAEPAMPKESERVITATHSEVSFVINSDLKAKLEECRALLGPRAAKMSFAELITAMTEVSVKALQEKQFGKKRAAKDVDNNTNISPRKAPEKAAAPAAELRTTRHIPQKLRHEIWRRDHKKCQSCGSKVNLQIDHVIPFGKGGLTIAGNLRLLCFHCNQRARIKEFGGKHQFFDFKGKS